MTRWILFAALCAGAVPAHAADADRRSARASLSEASARAGDRFRARARIARAPVVVLREGGRFVAIARMAKANASCGAPGLLRDGFEG